MGTREQFLDTATRLFAERGFYGASIAAIADELGLTKQALLHHFGSKERLYAEVLQRISQGFIGVVETAEAAAPDAEAQLQAFFAAFYAAATANHDETQLLMRELLDNRARAAEAETWYLKPFLDALVAIARRTRRWRQASDEAARAGIYQMLGAVPYIAVSEPTRAEMYGRARYDRLRRAFPQALADLIRAQLKKP